MKPDGWQRVKEIFQAALDLPPAERSAYVRSAAGDDDDLRREVESLLESADSSEDFLSEAAVDYVPGAVADAEIGRQIGHYRIVREIGSGGMGSVYLAERVDEFRQRAALKLMRRGMDSRQVVSRFRFERQILAGLDHPNIAHLLDGGATEDGRPYFVMEYVEGVPIDQWCAERDLAVRRRVELFRQVCAAVQYAHQRLVVHRDLKPGNILVGEDGMPKLLDFGIAKLLREEGPRETALTQVGVRPMTPEYASPEQVRGLAITTATDVYSLGVVLYELLAGKPPYTLETLSAIELDRVVCETDPPRPSAVAVPAVARHLAGDLDRIVMKAMEKDPQRRYASAEQFSEDLRRHLEGLPVMARPHTLMYRASRFVRRNRTAVAAGVVVVMSLAAGLAATTWQARIAERRFHDVRKLAGSFLFEFDEKIRDLAGATPARKLVVARALEYLAKLSREAGGDVSLKRDLAEAYLKIGDVQGNPYVSNLGDTAGAQASYREALRLAGEVVRRTPRDRAAAVYLARAHRSLGEVLPLTGAAAEAAGHLKESVAVLEGLPAATLDLPARFELISCYEMLGDVLGHSGIESLSDAKSARAAYEKALAAEAPILQAQPDNVRARRGTAVLRMKIGDMALDAGDMDQTIANYQAAAATLDALSAGDPQNAVLRRTAASAHRKLGFARETAAQPEAAMEEYRRTAAALSALMKADPENRQAAMDYVVTLKNIGDLHYKQGDKAAALASYRRALDILRPLSAAEPGNTVLLGRYARMLVYVGDTLAETSQEGEALRLCREGLEILKQLADRDGASASDVLSYAGELIDCPVEQLQDPAVALAYAKRAVEMTGGSQPQYVEQLARAHYSAGHWAEAVEWQEKVAGMVPAGPARAAAEKRLEFFRAGMGR